MICRCQCDQMVIIFSKLTIQNKEKLPKNIKYSAKVGAQFSQILNSYSRNGQKLFKILPKWQNFAKSGHTAIYVSEEARSEVKHLNKFLIRKVWAKVKTYFFT